LTERITKCEKKKKKGGLLGGLFGGSGNPDEDDDDQFDVIFAGKFKGILKVYNDNEQNEAMEKLQDQVMKIQMLFKDCYNLELAPHDKTWDLDLEKLNPEKIESYQ